MMNDTYVTVVGNIVDTPRHVVTTSGAHVANIRLASTSRKFDRELGKWRDGNTLFISVSCWRSLADNVAASVDKGDPLVVTGRLRMRSYTGKEGQKRVTPEIEAHAVGHDLTRGVTRFQKAQRLVSVEEPGRHADDESDGPSDESVEASPERRNPHTSQDDADVGDGPGATPTLADESDAA